MFKIYFIALATFISLAGYSQSPDNFIIKDEAVIWQKKFISNEKVTATFEKVILSGILVDAKIQQNIVYGNMRDFHFDISRYDKKLSLLQRAWLSTRYGAYLTLEINGDKVIATIKKIGMYSSIESSPANSYSDWEIWTIKKGDRKQFSNNFSDTLRFIINNEFTRMLNPLF